MSFEGKSGRNVHGHELQRGQEVRVRVGDQDLGIGIVDEVTVDGGRAVWIFFSGAAPRRVPTDDDSTEFTVLESDAPYAYVDPLLRPELRRRSEGAAAEP
jgi:hypothetical protein